MFFVYVIRSKTTGKIYIGQTDDVDKRVRQHNDPKLSKRSYTKLNGRDWQLIHKEEYSTRIEALKREARLKSHKGRDWLKVKLNLKGP